MLDRREFLGQLAGVAALAPSWLLAEQPRKLDRIGMQLYTVRAEMAKDVETTLTQVAALGYREVEFAGYFDHRPHSLRMMLGRSGLTSPSTHIDYVSLSARMPQVVEASHTIGHKFIVLPRIDEALRMQPDIYKRVAETLNRAGELAKKAGIKMAYHNNYVEFVPVAGKMPFDTLLAECDKDLVAFELDLAWVAAAGQDPLMYFAKYPGRFPMVHVKGLKKRPAPGAARPAIETLLADSVGAGGDLVDWARVFSASKQAGIRHYFVEHDRAVSGFSTLKASYQYLQNLRF